MERCRGARGASTGDSVVGLARLAIALPVFEGLHVLGLLHGLLPTWIIPVPPLGTPVLLELLVVVAKLVVPRLGHLLVLGLHRGGKGAASKTGVHRKSAKEQGASNECGGAHHCGGGVGGMCEQHALF